MTTAAADNFTLPSADQVRQHLEDHPPQGPSPWFARLPLLALVIIGALLLLGDTWLSLTLPWVILVALFVVMGWRGRQVQRLERRVGQCQEWAMRRYYRASLEDGWALLSQVQRQPLLRHRLIAVLGHCLEDLGCNEAAIEVYDHLLEDVEEDHPAAVQLHAHRAIAALGCDRLADADDALRQVQQNIDPNQPSSLSAAYHLARLLQEVRTHHYREATQRGEGMIDTLRPLGVEAGFGHALMAWCHRQHALKHNDTPSAPDSTTVTASDDETSDRAASNSDEHGPPSPAIPDHTNQMQQWWRRATLLLTPAAIVHRFPELAPLVKEDPR